MERTFLMVKPDGIAQQLIDTIRGRIIASNLQIVMEVDSEINRETIAKLYASVSGRDFYPEVLDHLSSVPLHFFLLEGENAISIARTIIGKSKLSGLRLEFATDVVRNVAHAPDCSDEASEQLAILSHLFAG